MKTNKNKRRNKNIVKQNNLDHPINPREAQNVTDRPRSLPGKVTEHEKNKNNEGRREGRTR